MLPTSPSSGARAPTVSSADQLRYEAGARRWAVPLTVAAALLPLAASLTTVFGLGTVARNQLSKFVVLEGHGTVLTIASILQALGDLALVATLYHLYRTARGRRPELPAVFHYVLIAGGVGAALVGTAVQAGVPPFGLVFQGLFAGQLGQFFSSGGQTYQQAADLFGSGPLRTIGLIQLVATFALLVSIVFLSLNAMRVGLLPKLMGYVGVLIGILVLLPLASGVPILPAFWLLALAYLFSGRWPGGLPPAWRTGQAEPWPSLQARREAAGRGAKGSDEGVSGDRGAAIPARAPAVPPAESPRPGAPARPGAARRKRKKRG